MRRIGWIVVVALTLAAGTARAEEAHEHEGHEHGGHEHGASTAQPQTSSAASSQEQTLTGEVVDVMCYLSHGKDGLGKGHASCAKKCIKSGLPVALKVGDQLYLATMANHDPANKRLGKLAGAQVTVRGKVMEQDGQHLIAIAHIEE